MSVQLRAPYSAPTKVIKIKNPELGDTDSTTNRMNLRKMMDGSLKTYIHTPQNRAFNWHFQDLTISQYQELEDFLTFAQGQDIELTDYNSNVFKVRCLTTILDKNVVGLGTGTTTVKEAEEITLDFEVVP